MGIPRLYPYPTKRPGFITNAMWFGPDDDLVLQLTYMDQGGVTRSVSLPTKNSNEGRDGMICLPATDDVSNLDRDLIVAHVRMATFISNTVAGSKEWTNSFVEQEGSQDFQLPVGTAAITDVRFIDDVNLEFDIKRKGNNPVRTIPTDHSELSSYTFTPSTQLLIVGGAVKVQFPNAVHDYPTMILSQADRNAIADYVLTLDPWI